MGLKKILNDQNYTEAMRGWLEADGRGAKILDMGCGTGTSVMLVCADGKVYGTLL